MVNNQNSVSSSPPQTVEGSPKEEKVEKKSGMGLVFFTLTLISIRVSGGIVGISYAAEHIGFLLTFILQTMYLPLGVLSCWMFLKAKDITGRASLSDLGIYSYGRTGIYLFNFLIALGNLGFIIIFLIVFGDVSANLLERLGVDRNSFLASRL
mmetsp:Transcript_17380/g.17097  ORF Transcript_17380/g.17097 Transcript_17380/m.17097 type:complete len:153 (-) Transcript_17380:965-1423(-)